MVKPVCADVTAIADVEVSFVRVMFETAQSSAPDDSVFEVLRQNFRVVVPKPNVFTVPLSVPTVLPTPVAAVVTTAGAPGVITKLCSTGEAGAKELSPGCVALIRQVPVETGTMFNPLTVQTEGVSEISVTVKLDEEVAPDAIGVVEKVLSAGLLNVIVCPVFESIGNVCVTGVAAEKLEFPG